MRNPWCLLVQYRRHLDWEEGMLAPGDRAPEATEEPGADQSNVDMACVIGFVTGTFFGMDNSLLQLRKKGAPSYVVAALSKLTLSYVVASHATPSAFDTHLRSLGTTLKFKKPNSHGGGYTPCMLTVRVRSPPSFISSGPEPGSLQGDFLAYKTYRSSLNMHICIRQKTWSGHHAYTLGERSGAS